MSREKIMEQLMELLEMKKEMAILEAQLRSAGEAFERLRIRMERIEKELKG